MPQRQRVLFLTSVQARSAPQSSAEQSSVETHRSPPFAPVTPVDRPSGFGKTLGWAFFFEEDVFPFGRVQ
jgi:hypothetical protein